jgi:hypothetical protein
MKKIFRNNRILLIAFLIIFSGDVSAASPVTNPGNDVPVSLSYAGNLKDQPIFLLSIHGSKDQDDFTIAIKDEIGNNLYSEKIKAERISKKFLLNTDEIGDETLRFVITSNRTGKTVSYEVNQYTRSGYFIKQIK